MVQYLHFRILEFPLSRGFLGMQRYAPYLVAIEMLKETLGKPYLKHFKTLNNGLLYIDWHVWKRNHVDWGINQKGSVLVGCARQTVKGSIQCHWWSTQSPAYHLKLNTTSILLFGLLPHLNLLGHQPRVCVKTKHINTDTWACLKDDVYPRHKQVKYK